MSNNLITINTGFEHICVHACDQSVLEIFRTKIPAKSPFEPITSGTFFLTFSLYVVEIGRQ